MRTQYDRKALEKDILDVIAKQPGIGTGALAKLIAEGTGVKLSTVQGVISDMGEKGVIVRTRLHKREEIEGTGFYRCWMTVPPGMKPEDFVRIKHEKKRGQEAKPTKQRELPLPPLKEIVKEHDKPIVLSVAERFAKLDSPVAPKLTPKPGTFMVHLVMPDGRTQAFTVGEARRMYDQLYGLFGANGL